MWWCSWSPFEEFLFMASMVVGFVTIMGLTFIGIPAGLIWLCFHISFH